MACAAWGGVQTLMLVHIFFTTVSVETFNIFESTHKYRGKKKVMVIRNMIKTLLTGGGRNESG